MSSTLQSIGAQAATIAYRLAFEVSPIVLVNGIAADSVDGMLPIIGLTGQMAAFAQAAALGGGASVILLCPLRSDPRRHAHQPGRRAVPVR